MSNTEMEIPEEEIPEVGDLAQTEGDNPPQWADAGRLFVIFHEGQPAGVEIRWSEAVVGAPQAAQVLDLLRKDMGDAGWITTMVMSPQTPPETSN